MTKVNIENNYDSMANGIQSVESRVSVCNGVFSTLKQRLESEQNY